MKFRLSPVPTLILLLSASLAPVVGGEDIAWETNLERAQRIATDTQRPLLLFVTSQHCGYCTRMRRDVFDEPGIQDQINRDFVALEVDTDQMPELAEQLRIRAVPASFVFSADGKALSHAAGYLSPEKFSHFLRVSRERDAE